jgi:hypothetical protein
MWLLLKLLKTPYRKYTHGGASRSPGRPLGERQETLAASAVEFSRQARHRLHTKAEVPDYDHRDND